MLNQTILVGRLTNQPRRIREEENEKNFVSITIAVPRNYKNINGEYDTDFVKIKLFNTIAENTIDYCKVGDLIGVKGRIESNGDKMEIIAEKITFLSSTNRGVN